ncbi:MAG TPA: hypothetical protein VGX23_07145 [Actinocrinis sp.]|nr:hypothetical protein [Actinocrinis sp.]
MRLSFAACASGLIGLVPLLAPQGLPRSDRGPATRRGLRNLALIGLGSVLLGAFGILVAGK